MAVLAGEASGRRPVATFAVLFVVAVLGGGDLPRSAAAASDDDAKADVLLVPGDPPLTEAMLSREARFLEWVLEAPLTAAQQDELRAHVVDAWRRGDRPSMEASIGFLAIAGKVFALPEAQRDLVRAQALPSLLEQWRAEADENPGSRWLLGIHEAAHHPLVAGTPPLTRQVSDAYAESLVFAAREITGRPFEADGAFKDAVAERLVGLYPQMGAQGRQALVRAPLLWAALRTAWPTLSESERQGLRRQWAASFGIAPPGEGVPRQVAGALEALARLAREPRTAPLTPDERRQVAGRMEIVAEYLRGRGTPQEAELAARYDEAARGFRASAAAAADDGARSRDAYEEAMEVQRRQHQEYVALMNASLTSHVGRMNMIAIMGGSPYRYSVR